MFYATSIKPFFDTAAALFLLVVASPLLLIIVAVNYMIYKKVLYTQTRAGRHMNAFSFIKFKTMNDRTDASGVLLPDVQRITRFGNILRLTSLDELPQLWLVIRGEMSMIGPRPLPVSYNSYYSEEQKKRFSVKPGISGLAQVRGRNKQTWEERFQWDVHYAEHCTFAQDFKILFLTVIQLCYIGEVNASSGETMPPFNG